MSTFPYSKTLHFILISQTMLFSTAAVFKGHVAFTPVTLIQALHQYTRLTACFKYVQHFSSKLSH